MPAPRVSCFAAFFLRQENSPFRETHPLFRWHFQIGLAREPPVAHNTPNYSEVFACPVRVENWPKPFRLSHTNRAAILPQSKPNRLVTTTSILSTTPLSVSDYVAAFAVLAEFWNSNSLGES